MDAWGSPYFTGWAYSPAFPTTAGAYDRLKGDGSGTQDDGFVTKLDPEGSALVYSTFIGCSSDDNIRTVAVDGAGNAYISGDTYSGDCPTTSGVYSQTYHGPSTLGVLTELNPTGSGLVFSTFLSNHSDDMALGPAGSTYVVEGD